MAWTQDYRAGHVELGGETVRGITRISIPANNEIQREISSGSQFPDSVHLNTQRPVATATTLDIAEAFEHLGTLGQCIVNYILYGQLQDCSGPAVSGHSVYTVASGVLVPTVLTVNHRDNAEVTYDCYAASPDGTTSPITRTTGSFSTGVAAQRFEMGPATIGGIALEGKRTITLNWNASVTQEGADGDVYDTVTSLSSVMPTAVIRGVNPTWFTTVADLLGKKTNDDTFFYLRKRDVADGTAEHIKIDLHGLISWNQLIDAGTDAPGEIELQVDTASQSTSQLAPIVVTLNSTIP